MTSSPTLRPTLIWQVVGFDALSASSLYQVLQLRSQVFVVEQACIFQDMDGFDAKAQHVLGRNAEGELLAYSRLFAPGVKMLEASIGRVVVAPKARGTGLGHTLIQRSLSTLASASPDAAIRIGAQIHLSNFYAQHGFVATGQPYWEDGIEHIEMLRKPPYEPAATSEHRR